MSFNQEKAEQFANGFLDALNAGAMCIMTSIGHRTGLFDTMQAMNPSTSQEIADAAGLNERYVREWLGAMTTSGVVELDADTGAYHLPPEHAAFLTRRAAPENMAVYAQYIPLLGSVENEIVRCFKEGGGVPYSHYPRFHAVMAEDSEQTVLSVLFEHILPLAPGLTEKLEKGIRVLDLGCGRGKAINMLAERYPNSEFVGMDLSAEAIAYAKREARTRGLGNATFTARDLTDFDAAADAARYDLITTFDAVHDQAKPINVLRGIYRALKDDGVYLMQDIHSTGHVHDNMDHPVGTLLYTVSCMHCMSVSLAQGGDGLGAMWGQELALKLLAEAGFTRVDVQQLAHDFQNDYYIIQK